jgi:hypothetical protein
MSNPKNTFDESQWHLDAMLYVLNDPALDRAEFEKRLEGDDRLAEILVESVAFYQATQNIEFGQPSPRIPTVSQLTMESDRSVNRVWKFATATALAASLLIAAFLSWKAIFPRNIGSYDLAQASSEASLRNVVLAWGDMQSDLPTLIQSRESTEFESESSIASLDASGEGDVPDWLVLATTDSLDGGIEVRDGKGLLQ